MSRRTFVIGGSGLFLFSFIGMLISADLASWWWHAGTIGAAIAIPLLLRDAPQRIKSAITRVFVAVVLLASLILTGVYIGDFFDIVSTAALHEWLNRNVLVSGIVFTAFIAAVLSPRMAIVFIVLATFLPFISMSRTPLIAVVAGTVIGVLLGVFFQMGKWKRFWQITTLLAIVGLAVSPLIVSRVYEDVLKVRNVLLSTNDVSTSRWNHSNAQFTDVQLLPEVNPPGRGGTVQELHLVRNRDHPFGASPVYQRGDPSEAGASYIASVWLRAEDDMKIIVSSNLNWVVCPVSTTWSRCVVPAGVGDGVKRSQFLFQFLDFQDDVTFQIWGPQLEIGETPTPVQHRSLDGDDFQREKSFLERLNISEWGEASTVKSRLALWKVSIRGITEKPLAGHGLSEFPAYFDAHAQSTRSEGHSHNLFLEVLFERGLIGLLVLFGQFILVVRFLQPARLPLVLITVFVVFLESANFQFYSTLVYYPFWLGLALLPPRSKKPTST